MKKTNHFNKNNWARMNVLEQMGNMVQMWNPNKSLRIKELLRARELFVPSVLTSQEDDKLKEYFFQFALAAGRDK